MFHVKHFRHPFVVKFWAIMLLMTTLAKSARIAPDVTGRHLPAFGLWIFHAKRGVSACDYSIRLSLIQRLLTVFARRLCCSSLPLYFSVGLQALSRVSEW